MDQPSRNNISYIPIVVCIVVNSVADTYEIKIKNLGCRHKFVN